MTDEAATKGRINGIDLEALRAYVAAVAEDPTQADRDPVVVARWVGSERAEVSAVPGAQPVHVGGAGEPSAMRLLLGSLAACDIDLIANRASLLGIEIEELTVEASGHFNVQRYLGLEAQRGPGYERIGYLVRLRTKGATADQLSQLRRACEEDSPVADTLRGGVALSFEFVAR